MIDLAGQTAVVTGATSGIGRSVAFALANRGVNLLLVGRDPRKTERVREELGAASPAIDAQIWIMDLAGDIEAAAADMAQQAATVDILVHSAGALVLSTFDGTTPRDLDLHYRVNARAPFIITQHLLPTLRRQQGQIVFVNSSVSHQKAKANAAAYSASKYALVAIADSLRDEVNKDGVRVLSVFPGRTATPMQENIHRLENRAYRGDRLLQPEDVAETIVTSLSLPRTAEVTDIMVRPFRKS